MRLYASLGGAPDPGDTVMFNYFLDEPASD